jgi:hypothetical protein
MPTNQRAWFIAKLHNTKRGKSQGHLGCHTNRTYSLFAALYIEGMVQVMDEVLNEQNRIIR